MGIAASGDIKKVTNYFTTVFFFLRGGTVSNLVYHQLLSPYFTTDLIAYAILLPPLFTTTEFGSVYNRSFQLESTPKGNDARLP